MIQHHIAIICSSERSVRFYNALGFAEKSRIPRENDTIIWMSDGQTTLELFIDPTHPPRVDRPEAMGLRHLAFETENVRELREQLLPWNPEEILIRDGVETFFVKDPDGCPMEIRGKA